ncbi:MAG: mechanosensitive ion channel [Nitrospiraceae bacterium]|nr:MAG: mechanosensitive ion channel [Nitrospiraceae bacterium]
MKELTLKVWELLTVYGIKIIAAIVILIIGKWIAGVLEKLVQKIMKKKEIDPTIISFVGNLTFFALMTFVILAALSQIGIQTTSFIAVIGAAGLAVGLALQGSLSNFAAGFLMIIFRPFKVGDYIEGAGTAGTVEKIQLFTTQLTTPDNKTVIIPNTKLTDDNIINYTAKGTRRVELVAGISYDDDIDKARNVLSSVIAEDERILKDPAPLIAVSAMADSSVNFVIRPWVNSGDYWSVYFSLTENIKKRFDQEGISIPFPQRDVHIYEHKD